VVVVINPEKENVSLSEDFRLTRQLLGLKEGTGEFEITYGLLPRHGREVAILSRSVLDIILQLGFGVDLPAGHATDGRASPSSRMPGDPVARPLAHVLSGPAAPPDAYAAIRYKDYWYWIDDHDITNKRAFTFLLILFSLVETGPAASAPVVTVPYR